MSNSSWNAEDTRKMFERAAKIPQWAEVQWSLMDQLMVLQTAASRLGLYDAADFLAKSVRNRK